LEIFKLFQVEDAPGYIHGHLTQTGLQLTDKNSIRRKRIKKKRRRPRKLKKKTNKKRTKNTNQEKVQK